MALQHTSDVSRMDPAFTQHQLGTGMSFSDSKQIYRVKKIDALLPLNMHINYIHPRSSKGVLLAREGPQRGVEWGGGSAGFQQSVGPEPWNEEGGEEGAGSARHAHGREEPGGQEQIQRHVLTLNWLQRSREDISLLSWPTPSESWQNKCHIRNWSKNFPFWVVCVFVNSDSFSWVWFTVKVDILTEKLMFELFSCIAMIVKLKKMFQK